MSGGQTTLLIFVCMLVALNWSDSSSAIAGLFLGIALSKYSLAFPLFLFLLYKKKYLAIGISLLVQFLGAVIISVWGGSSLVNILESYIYIFKFHTGLEGIHLGAWIHGDWGIITATIFTLLVSLGLVFTRIKRKRLNFKRRNQKFEDLCLLNILSIWAILVAYHRKYDATLYILFIALMIYVIYNNNIWNLSTKFISMLKTVFFTRLIAMSIPGGGGFEKLLPTFLADNWSVIMNGMTTIILLLTLIYIIWLRFKLIGMNSVSDKEDSTRVFL